MNWTQLIAVVICVGVLVEQIKTALEDHGEHLKKVEEHLRSVE